MKSFDARNSDAFLRNAHYGLGFYDMPVIYRQRVDLSGIEFLGFHNTRSKDAENGNKTVHFFIDDSKFERVWNRPQQYCLS